MSSSENEIEIEKEVKKENKKVAKKSKYQAKVAKIESDDDRQSDDDRVDEPVERLWRLVKPKWLYTFKLNGCCSDRLFDDKNKFKTIGDEVIVSIRLCKECRDLNLMATDLLAPSPKKKETKKAVKKSK